MSEKAETENYQRPQETRGVWAESVFVARAAENGLEISKPFGDSGRFDCVVGGPGKFVAVQVKCTMAKLPAGKGYIRNLKCNNKKYRAGSFDFLAGYVIPEDAWYIVPEKAIRGLGSICLCSAVPKYEQYREAWQLLREAGCEEATEETVIEPQESPVGPGIARMQGAMNFFRSYLEKGGR